MAAAEPLSRNRDFTRLWVGQALSVFGTRISWVAYPLLVLGLTHSAARAAVVGFASWIPAIVFGLPAGALVDRWERRRVMIACDIGRVLVVGSLAGALIAGIATYEQVLATAFAERMLGTLFDPAETSALRNLVPANQLATAIARNESRDYGAFLLGPPAGGALFAIARSLPFVADAASYAVSTVSLLSIRRRFESQSSRRSSQLAHDVREGLAHMLGDPFLRVSAAFSAGSNFVTNGVGLATIIVAREDLGASSAAVGVMLTISGAGGLVGSLAAPRLQARLSPRVVVAAASSTWTAAIPLLIWPSSPYVLGALIGAGLALMPAWNAVLGSYRIALTPDRLQGRVQSAISLCSLGGSALGTLASGLLLQSLGRTETFSAFACVMGLIAAASVCAPALTRRLARPVGSPAMVEEGKPAPDFELTSDSGEQVKLSDFRGKPVVLYFYPKSDTPGCTAQACGIRDSFADFEQAGAVVLGVSSDKEAAQAKFKSKYELPFAILADPDHVAGKAYGVEKPDSNYFERSTFLIDADGNVAKIMRKVDARKHADQVLAALSS